MWFPLLKIFQFPLYFIIFIFFISQVDFVFYISSPVSLILAFFYFFSEVFRPYPFLLYLKPYLSYFSLFFFLAFFAPPLPPCPSSFFYFFLSHIHVAPALSSGGVIIRVIGLSTVQSSQRNCREHLVSFSNTTGKSSTSIFLN